MFIELWVYILLLSMHWMAKNITNFLRSSMSADSSSSLATLASISANSVTCFHSSLLIDCFFFVFFSQTCTCALILMSTLFLKTLSTNGYFFIKFKQKAGMKLQCVKIPQGTN